MKDARKERNGCYVSVCVRMVAVRGEKSWSCAQIGLSYGFDSNFSTGGHPIPLQLNPLLRAKTSHPPPPPLQDWAYALSLSTN